MTKITQKFAKWEKILYYKTFCKEFCFNFSVKKSNLSLVLAESDHLSHDIMSKNYPCVYYVQIFKVIMAVLPLNISNKFILLLYNSLMVHSVVVPLFPQFHIQVFGFTVKTVEHS